MMKSHDSLDDLFQLHLYHLRFENSILFYLAGASQMCYNLYLKISEVN